MFTAIVLVCLNGIKEPAFCQTYINNQISYSRSECMLAISNSISDGVFEYYVDEEMKTHVVDYRCVNWEEVTL
jgi:hypothetical protein